MPEINVQAIDPPTSADAQNKPMSQPEATLQDILDTMHDSEIFPRTAKDAPSRFWSAYERVATQHDNEFLDRHNGDLDVLLIFAGLFSAISSAFIVNMQSSLSPNASDTTNALLKILVNKIDNTTFSAQEASLPVWNGPSSTTIWIQSLAYTSLSSSLLAAFGAMLGKQWLGHFKTSRFGRGALHERCQRRQQKLDGLKAWHLSTILATLPIFLQLSLFFFGVALAANIWTLQHTVASVIMATTVFGLIFYFFAVVSSLKSPDCPFQTPLSTVLQHVFRDIAPLQTLVRQKWKRRPKTWASFRDHLLEVSRHALHMTKGLITKSIRPFVVYFLRLKSALRRVGSLTNDSEVVGMSDRAKAVKGVEQPASVAAGEQTALFDLNLDSLGSHPELAQVYAVQCVRWILETSTDTDIITAAARLVLEVEWPADVDVTEMLYRLKVHLYTCFGPTRRIIPLAHERAVTWLKAMCHFYVKRDIRGSVVVHRDGTIWSRDDLHVYQMVPDQAFHVVYCAVNIPIELDIRSLLLSDRVWMAHIFTYRLKNGDRNEKFITFVIDFIGICLDSKSPAYLVADCLLLVGMLIGLPIDRQHLVKCDKSSVIAKLQKWVMQRTLDLLVGDISGPEWYQNALKLVHPLLQDFDQNISFLKNRRLFEQGFKYCFRLLEEHPETPEEEQIRSKNILILLRRISYGLFWKPGNWFTPAHFDLLVDYHLQIYAGTDHKAVGVTFRVLTWLNGTPSTPDRMHRYIDTTIYFMDQETTRNIALDAACAIRSGVGLTGRDDQSMRERFCKALTSAVLGDVTQTPPNDNPFKEVSFFHPRRDIAYLGLLSTLSQEPVWHPQLHQSGHFDSCLAIANTLISQRDARFDHYTVHVAHIFALIDASGVGHPFFNAIQGYPSWPLVLRAWRSVFRLNFFRRNTRDNWMELARTGYLEGLPHLIAYAKRRFKNREEHLIMLIELVCHKRHDEMQQREQDGFQHIREENPFVHREIHALGKQICELLDT